MTNDVLPRLADFVRHVTEAMGVSLRSQTADESEHIRLSLEGDGGDLLVRRRGEALDALQHVVNAAFRRTLGKHVVVDCMEFRRAKETELREMARRLADRAKATGEAQEMGPLNPYFRRIVHLAVAEDPEVASESVGDAFLKTVVIAARKPPKHS